MSGASIEVIVTVPGRTAAEARGQLAACAASGADAAEIRFDRWDESRWGEIPSLFPAPLPLVATYRSRAEGGGGSDDATERQRRLELLDRLPFRYLDLERRRDGVLIDRLLARDSPPRPILSTHLSAAWQPSDVEEGLRRSPARGSALTKVVVPASVSALYASLRPMLPISSDRGPATLLTTGGSGPILRALSSRLGLAAVYAAPSTAPGSSNTEQPVERSQIPIDALEPFLRRGPAGRLFALLGHPVAHSLSPQMHDGWYAREGRHALFVPIDIHPEERFGECVDHLAHDAFDGFNVTHPWKQEALAFASHASDDARRAGCANTLTRTAHGWSADNFDVRAVVRRARELRAASLWDGDDILVLGAGGAARAAVVAASILSARARVLARDPAGAREMGVELAQTDGPPASLVIHATTTGMAGNPRPITLDWEPYVRPTSYVLDMVYHPERPEIREGARRRGASYEDGSRLLVYQASDCHRRWWGEAPGPELEAWALREVVCAA